jgi:hypothetical protein
MHQHARSVPLQRLSYQPRHRFLEPIHNVKDRGTNASTAASRGSGFLHLWKNGGAYRDRTDDLKLAKLALSQLS